MKYKLLPFLILIICLFSCKHGTDTKTQVSDIGTTRIKNIITEIRFIDYNDVFNNIYNNLLSEKEEQKYKVSLEYMLLLDTAHIQSVAKKYPKLVDEFRDTYDFLDYSEIENNSRKHRMKFIETDIKSLKECLKNDDVLVRILSNNFGQAPLHRVRIDEEIYIKDDKTAVFWIYGTGSELIRTWKFENGLYIEHIKTIMS